MWLSGSKLAQTAKDTWQVTITILLLKHNRLNPWKYRFMFVPEFCDYMEVLQHVSIRWLSLERCVTRILRLYHPLAGYFKSASKISQSHNTATNTIYLICTCFVICLVCFLIDEKQLRFKRLKQLFSDPMTEVYLLFFQAIMPVFTSFRESSHVYSCYMTRYKGCDVFLLSDTLFVYH